MTEIKRWYDESPKLSEFMKVLSSLSEKEVGQIAQYLYQVVNILWKRKKSGQEIISLGNEKLLNYYKAYRKRRWYDKNSSLGSALNIMSTLEVKELEIVVDGFLLALREAGLDRIYSSKLEELSKEEND